MSFERDEPLKLAVIVYGTALVAVEGGTVRDLNRSFSMHHLFVPGSVTHAKRKVV